MKARLALTFCLALVSSGLWAASFDCAKARTPLEKTICSDSSLSAADDELNAVWKSTLKTFPLPAFLRTSQQLWLKEIARCVQAKSCVSEFSSRTNLLKHLGGAKVYTDYGKEFSIDSVTLVIFEVGGESFIWMYGDWMPDMNNPQPPPNGFLLNNVSRIAKQGNGKYRIVDEDYEFAVTEDAVTFGDQEHSLMISARQGSLSGVFGRIR
jgi:uncharacterized protein YecT (DUF1311 family)